MAKKPSSHEKSTAPLASGVPVFCRFDEIVPAAALKLYPGNYRKHPATQLEAAYSVIVGDGTAPGNGWRRPAVVSTLSGCVTKGNGMVQMAQRHGLDVPVEYQAYKSRSEEIRDLIADNRLQELATDDSSALKALIGELSEDELPMTAISAAEMDAIIAQLDPVELKPVKIVPPPATAWVLIGIPLQRFKEIQPHVEAISALPGVEYHSATSTKPIEHED